MILDLLEPLLALYCAPQSAVSHDLMYNHHESFPNRDQSHWEGRGGLCTWQTVT